MSLWSVLRCKKLQRCMKRVDRGRKSPIEQHLPDGFGDFLAAEPGLAATSDTDLEPWCRLPSQRSQRGDRRDIALA